MAQAALFKEQGARWIHVVDLDGARSGVPENIDIIERVIKETGLKIEVGGVVAALKPSIAWLKPVFRVWCWALRW